MLNKKLIFLRNYYNITQKEMSQELNLERSTYTYYELGRSTPTIETLIMLAMIFDVSVDYLVLDNINIKDYDKYSFIN